MMLAPSHATTTIQACACEKHRDTALYATVILFTVVDLYQICPCSQEVYIRRITD